MEESNQQQFWQFSDKLRGSNHFPPPSSLNNDSIWSTSYVSKRTDHPRNFDFNNNNTNFLSDHFTLTPHTHKITENHSRMNLKTDFNSADYLTSRFKAAVDLNLNHKDWSADAQKSFGINNGGFNKGIYTKNYHNNNSSSNNFKNKQVDEDFGAKFAAAKKSGNKNNHNNNDGGAGGGVEKRFKTLPPSESLPRNETVGGYIFVCNNDTMQENLQRQLFGLPPRYRDSVRAITPGLPLFLYNYSTHQLHGVFEAASFGGSNIEPTAWEDKKCRGESRFPAQVKVVTRKLCEPLEEDSFRPILHHYDGPKFRLELNIPEALSLLDIFEEDRST